MNQFASTTATAHAARYRYASRLLPKSRHARTLAGLIALGLLILTGCSSGHGNGGPGVSSIQLTPTNPSLAKGTSLQLAATAILSDSSHSDVAGDLAWGSSNTAVATVSSSGKITSVGPGTAIISVICSVPSVCDSVASETTVTVTPPTSQISGIVAYGTPVAGKAVVARDSAAQNCATATTASDGSYSMDTTNCAPGSVALYVEGYTTPSGASLLSVAVPPQAKLAVDGVANVDPLSTLLAYAAAGLVAASAPPTNATQVIAVLPQVTAAQLQQATMNLLTASLTKTLQGTYGIPMTGFSPVTTPFTANGQGLDKFFDEYPLTAPTSASVQLTGDSGEFVRVTLPTVAGSSSGVTSTVSYSVGGEVSGLSGASLTLLLNGASPLSISANGAYTFPTSVSSTYAVTIGTQPTGQTCTVSSGSGAGVTSNVSTVRIVCSTLTYRIGGSVTGLAVGTHVTLDNNGADPVTVTANGALNFSTPVAYGGSYAVTVTTQPTGQICTVSSGTGAGVTSNVSTVTIVCSTLTYRLGGSVTGLAAGTQVTLDNNGADPLNVTADGSFTFSTPVAYGGGYAVTVGTQATGQTCTVSNGTGSGVSANVTTVSIACSTLTYTIGGSVSGLGGGDQVTLENNGANPLTVAADGAFTFTAPVAYDGSYAVTVGTQPTGQTCTATNGTGAGVTANVSIVNIVCSTLTYTIGGNITGLASGAQVTFDNNGANPLTVTANGAFTFTTPVAYGGSYLVTVDTQPTGQTCTVSNGTGAGVSANVITASIVCSTLNYTIGGNITGLASGAQVTLDNNGANPLTVTANGTFTFTTPVAYGGSYAVTVGTQPNGQTCTVSDGTGTGITSNVTNVAVNCPDAVAYIYVPNYGSNNVLGYRFDLTTGAMSNIPGSGWPSGSNDRWVTTNTAGTFAYVTNQGGASVSAYTIDPSSGALTEVTGSPFSTASQPVSVTLNPAGTFAYVVSSGDVSAYTIDQTTGALTEVSGSPFAAGSGASKIAINPTGTFAFVANTNDNTISVYSIDPTSGALTAVSGSPFANGSGNGPEAVTVNPAGTVLYVTNWQANVTAYTIDTTSGALTSVSGSPFTATYTGWGWQSLAVNPAGTLALVSTGNGGELLSFSIDPSTGALTQLTADAYGAYNYNGANYVVFNATGTRAFVSNAYALFVSVVSVNSTTGAVTDVSGSPFGVGARPFDIAVVQP